MNIWNKNEIITPVSEYQLMKSYQKHLHQIIKIKATPIQVDQPYMQKKQVCNSKKIKEDTTIKKALVTRILEINHCPSYYGKLDTSDVPRPSNLGQKIIDMKRLIQDNESIERRLRQTSSVISFDKIKKEYKQSKKYLKNITQNSRRIYNCFLPQHFRSETPAQSRTVDISIKKHNQTPLPKI
ncbi:unnamed protein product [Paramecium sonneborni]|uniref:Uncharacterized protein n=1 Tax=Paramecium sonneborni TaxID=65129 RepID=A0A8S1LMS0_9CILI|nr:unnamed protein product [Paramecium sonneborni]